MTLVQVATVGDRFFVQFALRGKEFIWRRISAVEIERTLENADTF